MRASSSVAPRSSALNAINGRRAPTMTPPAVGWSSVGPKSGRRLLREPGRELLGAAASEERRPPAARQLAVEEDGQAELAHPLGQAKSRRLRPLHVGRPQRHNRDDVCGADPRVRSLVSGEIDPIPRNCNRIDERVDERIVFADQGEYRPVVIGIGVHVEQSHPARQSDADRLDRGRIAPLREVRHRLERQHGPTLRGAGETPQGRELDGRYGYLEKRPRPKKPRRASTRMMMRIQSQIDMKPFRRLATCSLPRRHVL